MFIPTKHEDLQKNIIIIGYDIIKILQKKEYNIEDLFQQIKQIFDKDISINQYYNTLTFLWTVQVIEVEEFKIKLKK